MESATTDQAPSWSGRGRAGARTRLIIAILIAATSVLAGFATWRSDAATGPGRAQRGRHPGSPAPGRNQEIDANLNDSRITLVRVRVDDRRARAQDEARTLPASAGTKQRAPWRPGTRRWPRPSRAHRPGRAGGGATPAAFKRARPPHRNRARAPDLDPRPELKQAADHNQRADDLRELGVAALVAVLLLTCAEVSRRLVPALPRPAW
jgi:hypothetical protein